MLRSMTPPRRVHVHGSASCARRSRLARWGVLIAPALLLASCRYTATVRNHSSKTVVAEIRHDRFLAPMSTPASAHLRPGESASLGPFKIDPLEPINLRVRVVGDVFGAWIENRLEPGDQLFVVEDGNLESWEAVRVRRAPMDEPETPGGDDPAR